MEETPSVEFELVEVKEELVEGQGSSNHLSSFSGGDRVREPDRIGCQMMNSNEDLKVEVKDEPFDDHSYANLPHSSEPASGMGSLSLPPLVHTCAWKAATSALCSHIVNSSEKRSSPIGEVAKDFLIELIKQEDILHSKKTDGYVSFLKKQAWERVAKKYNAAGYGPPKDAHQVLKIWERTKAKAKREHAETKRQQRKIGDGVAPPANTTETVKVLGIIGNEVRDLGCANDSDAYPSNYRKMTMASTARSPLSAAAGLVPEVPQKNEIRRIQNLTGMPSSSNNADSGSPVDLPKIIIVKPATSTPDAEVVEERIISVDRPQQRDPCQERDPSQQSDLPQHPDCSVSVDDAFIMKLSPHMKPSPRLAGKGKFGGHETPKKKKKNHLEEEEALLAEQRQLVRLQREHHEEEHQLRKEAAKLQIEEQKLRIEAAKLQICILKKQLEES